MSNYTNDMAKVLELLSQQVNETSTASLMPNYLADMAKTLELLSQQVSEMGKA